MRETLDALCCSSLTFLCFGSGFLRPRFEQRRTPASACSLTMPTERSVNKACAIRPVADQDYTVTSAVPIPNSIPSIGISQALLHRTYLLGLNQECVRLYTSQAGGRGRSRAQLHPSAGAFLRFSNGRPGNAG